MRPTTNVTSKQQARLPAPRDLATRATGWAASTAFLAMSLLASSPATAQDINFTLHLEPDLAVWVDDPQATRFTPGLYAAVRPGISLGQIVALQWTYALLWTPAADGFTEDGSAHFLMAGVRVRPLATLMPASDQLGGLFVDFNIGYVRTGELDRLGLDVGLGYGFQITPEFSLGPVVRYVQIVQPDSTPSEDPNDAQLLVFGVDFAFGPAPRAEPERESDPGQSNAPEDAVVASVEPLVCAPTDSCADADRDGVCDEDDHCPSQIGPPATLGCPIDPCSGTPLMVLVQFPFDSAQLPAPRADEPQTMDPVLEAVASAILRDAECRVCIIGYASEEGEPEYNVELSSRRAAAVRGYMTARGLSESRMPTVGLGAMCQLVPEATDVLNRRVEFRRLDEGETCPTTCAAQAR
jgi:outer membrane protein OmpA-like peptidoglycan-associated protein